MMSATRQNAAIPAAITSASGIARGTEVMTLNGVRPVEALHEGDRIVTRTGARMVQSIVRTGNSGFLLMFDKPQVVFLSEGQVHSDTGLPFAA